MEDRMSLSEERSKYWNEHYNAFNEAGLTQREFCKQNNLKYWTFNQWKRRFDKSESDVTLQELPIKLSKKLNSNNPIEIILNDNIRLSIPDGFSETTLKTLIDILGNNNEN